MVKGGVKNPEKLTPSFMDAPYVNMCLNARINSNTYEFEKIDQDDMYLQV